jgi:hypothetical protein
MRNNIHVNGCRIKPYKKIGGTPTTSPIDRGFNGTGDHSYAPGAWAGPVSMIYIPI